MGEELIVVMVVDATTMRIKSTIVMKGKGFPADNEYNDDYEYCDHIEDGDIDDEDLLNEFMDTLNSFPTAEEVEYND